MDTSYTLITGASSGIGLALAKQFASQKHNLILVARRKTKLTEAATLLRKEGIKVQIFTADLATTDGAQTLYQEIKDKKLCVDTLVNNAGRGNAGEFCDQDYVQMQGTMQLNMASMTVLTRLFLDDMKHAKHGYILNIASVAAFMPGPGFAIYHATKAFVLSLSEALHNELEGTGISVTASCPGPTESEFHQHADTADLKPFKLISLMTAEQVAQEAYQAMKERKPFVIHGLMNQVMTSTPKILPRKFVTALVRKLMTK